MLKPSPEDLTQEVVTADDAKRKTAGRAPVKYSHAQRVWIEPFFNLLGRIWGMILFLLPWSLRKPFIQFIIRGLGGHAPAEAPAMGARIRELVQLAQDLKEKTGQWPALLVATSHPATEGEWHWLRFEMMAQGVEIANAMIGAREPGKWFYPHPRCLLAIDPFALDTVPPMNAGFYAGWMHQIYLAYDRQSWTQSWIQRFLLLKNSTYKTIAARFLKLLRSDVPVIMAFGGGLPYNARLLYTTREFVHQLKPPRWKISKRAAQLELLKILLQPEGMVWPAEQGELSSAQRKAIASALAHWGTPSEKIDDCLQQFVEEFRQTVPCRKRLLRVLYSRLVKRQKPLIILPISHSATAPHIVLGPPLPLEVKNWDFRPICDQLANIFDPFSSK